jgi:hypothetical protein
MTSPAERRAIAIREFRRALEFLREEEAHCSACRALLGLGYLPDSPFAAQRAPAALRCRKHRAARKGLIQ